jgi:16S rRNA (guanine(966)-N(2))-methyltransferase RsmD
MRVVSGLAKGRRLKSVPGRGTRPTSDKVKEAIFSMIGPYFDGGRVLDLYAGTGGLGIEALSRGMASGVFIDAERTSVQVVRENLEATGLSAQAEVYRNEAERAVKVLAKRGLRFDLVLLDPPYRMHDMDARIEEMDALGILEPNCTIVIEHEADYPYPGRIGRFTRVRSAQYGDTAISVYREDSYREPAQGSD